MAAPFNGWDVRVQPWKYRLLQPVLFVLTFSPEALGLTMSVTLTLA